jgi:hypothetical protein
MPWVLGNVPAPAEAGRGRRQNTTVALTPTRDRFSPR